MSACNYIYIYIYVACRQRHSYDRNLKNINYLNLFINYVDVHMCRCTYACVHIDKYICIRRFGLAIGDRLLWRMTAAARARRRPAWLFAQFCRGLHNEYPPSIDKLFYTFKKTYMYVYDNRPGEPWQPGEASEVRCRACRAASGKQPTVQKLQDSDYVFICM